jgi:hypothetical protein
MIEWTFTSTTKMLMCGNSPVSQTLPRELATFSERTRVFRSGSMAKKLPDRTVPPGKGNVFIIDTRGGVKAKKLFPCDLSNGLCWNPQETNFFWADTLRKKVYKYDYDKVNLSVSKCTFVVIVRLSFDRHALIHGDCSYLWNSESHTVSQYLILLERAKYVTCSE